MKSFFGKLSTRFPFFANRPSALERAVRQSPKSRRLRMEPLENRALLAVDAFGGAASLVDSDVGESWGPDPAPAAFSASVLATDAAIVDVSGIDVTSADASFSIQVETPTPVAPPSFDQLMESLGMIEIESLGDENDVASLSFLDAATDEIAATSDATVRRVVFEGSDVDAEALDEPTVVVPTVSINDESVSNGARSGGGDPIFYNVSCKLTSSIASSFDDFSNPLSERVVVDGSTATTDYLAVTLPEVPYGYYTDVTIGGEASYGIDFLVYTYNEATQRFELNSFYGSNFQYSGGATTFYIAPRDDAYTEPIETVTYTLSEPKQLGSGGGTLSANELIYGSLTATATIVDDDADVVVYWRDGSGANGAELSGNPNGGGFRVFPEQTNSNEDSLRNQVDLVFRLDAAKSVDTTVYCRLLDPDNYISLGNNQPTDGSFAPNDNNWSFNLPNSVVIPAGKVEYVLHVTISDAYAGDNFIVVADTDPSAVAAAALGTTEATRYQLVQPVANQPAYTQMLTVWRTLWVERDQFVYQAENHIRLAEFPITAGLVSNAFQNACVLVQDSPTNPVNSTLGPLYLNANQELETHENGLPQTYAANCLTSPIASNDKFWYAHLIGAFWADLSTITPPAYGIYYSPSEYGFSVPTAFIFQSELGANVLYASEFAEQVVLAKLAYLWNATVPQEGIDGLSAEQIREIQSSTCSR